MMEAWRAVVGFEGLYEASSLGRVRSLDRLVNMAHGAKRSHRGRVLRPVPDKDGYPRVMLRVDGLYYTRAVHRLVCEAFHGPGNALHREVDHIDRDTSNAAADNLRWVSKGQNMTRRIYGWKCILTPDSVRIIRTDHTQTAKALAVRYGVTPHTIYAVRNRKRWKNVV